MTLIVAPSRGTLSTLQSPGSTTGNGNVLAIHGNFTKHTILIKGSSGVSAGAVQLECSDVVGDAGTWAPIGGGPITILDGADVEYTWMGPFTFIRARISTDLVGGTVGVTYQGT